MDTSWMGLYGPSVFRKALITHGTLPGNENGLLRQSSGQTAFMHSVQVGTAYPALDKDQGPYS